MATQVRLKFLSIIVVLVTVHAAWCFDCSDGSNAEKVQVHLVPHSHDDVGWLKTVDEYFYGANQSIQDAGVQYILDTVVQELAMDSSKKFIYVEIAFFQRWWDEQNEPTKKLVRRLVKDRQLEFINGGWCMSDEAATHYNAIIDQMTYGLRWIRETFGDDARPTVAWHIDPFGHSAEQASIFSQMSFDGFFLGRIDYADKNKRIKEQRMEMIWRGSRNLGASTDIFNGVLFHNYSPPPSFCWDELCHDNPIMDDARMFDVNVKERVDTFVKYVCGQASHFQTNNVILTMGEDFNYQNARKWYKNMDKLIKYVNKDGRANVFYSTPSIYLKALHDAGKTWEVKSDDFFPYSHRPHSYWTGYFTSRPALKRYIRESNTLLQTCNQVEAMGGKVAFTHSSDTLRRAMAVNQHHDAVTGTEKQHVANDYAKRLHMGRTQCQDVVDTFLENTYPLKDGQSASFRFQRCDYLNISVCRITEKGGPVAINVYNPSPRHVQAYAQIPVNSKKTSVIGPTGEPVGSQVMPLSPETVHLREKLRGHSTYELFFPIDIPPLGFSTYFINPKTTTIKPNASPKRAEYLPLTSNRNYIENDYVRLIFSYETGRLVQMSNLIDATTNQVEQNFYYYEGSDGKATGKDYQTSGAYIFRPRQEKPLNLDKYGKTVTTILVGPLVSEVRQSFCPFVSQVIRLYKDKPYAEFEYTVGPIPVGDKIGKEIITRFDTNIENNDVFYTDANGREMKQRKRDYRETWDLDLTTEAVSRNYFPINSRVFINDSNSQFTVLTDRSQGGSSIRNGQLELMIHRRLLHDDFLGVGEALDEKGRSGRGLVTRGKYHVFLSEPKTANKLHRNEGELMMMEPVFSFSKNPYTVKEWMSSFRTSYTGLQSDGTGVSTLPENIHILTLQRTKQSNQLLLRLEHFFEKDEDAILSKPVKVNLGKIFKGFSVRSFEEMNLSANQLLKDKKMWRWNTRDQVAQQQSSWIVDPFRVIQRRSTEDVNFDIWLTPMQIRTFILTVEYI